MNETEKCRIRLAHWKDHNVDHVKGYEEVAHILEELGVPKASEMIRRGICFVEAANVEFEKALKALASAGAPAGESPAEPETSSPHVHRHAHDDEHSHTHEHDHGHEHAEHHGHGHEHGHSHSHGHEHEQGHCGRHHHHHTSGPDAHSGCDKDKGE